MTQCDINIHVLQLLKIQNRTGANTTTELDATSIEANPIQGKIYMINRSNMLPGWNNDTTITDSWSPNNTTGIVSIDPNEASLNAGIANLLKRPPHPSNIQRCYASINARLEPGQIKNAKIVYKDTGNFQRFFANILYNGTESIDSTSHGNCMALCFEKTLATTTGTAVVKIGYEKNLYIDCDINIRKSKPFVRENL